MGRFAEAVSDIEKNLPKPISVSLDAKGYCEAAQGLGTSVRSSAMAVAFAISGDHYQAFEYLEKAYSDGDSELLIVIRYPALDPIRSGPRYVDLMRRLGLPE
jgi:hypothetical protein